MQQDCRSPESLGQEAGWETWPHFKAWPGGFVRNRRNPGTGSRDGGRSWEWRHLREAEAGGSQLSRPCLKIKTEQDVDVAKTLGQPPVSPGKQIMGGQGWQCGGRSAEVSEGLAVAPKAGDMLSICAA